MITLYSWPTPNATKVHIMLEECGLRRGRDWNVVQVDINAGAQCTPWFLSISPNGKIPVIVDSESTDGQPITVFESGAILLYLAEKTGQLMPKVGSERYHVFQWLMFQLSGLGPTLGQNRHFRSVARERIEYAIERYTTEALRLFQVVETQLASTRFIAGDTYTLADIAIFPSLGQAERHGIAFTDYPHLKAWSHVIAQRPAVRRVMSTDSSPASSPNNVLAMQGCTS